MEVFSTLVYMGALVILVTMLTLDIMQLIDTCKVDRLRTPDITYIMSGVVVYCSFYYMGFDFAIYGFEKSPIIIIIFAFVYAILFAMINNAYVLRNRKRYK